MRHATTTSAANKQPRSFPNQERKTKPEISWQLNLKASNQTNLYFAGTGRNQSLKVKIVKFSADDFLRLYLWNSKRVLDLNFMQTQNSWTVHMCMCVYVCICVLVSLVKVS